MTLTDLLTTPEPFRAWLEGKKPGEIVGERSSCSFCPVAKFAREVIPGVRIYGPFALVSERKVVMPEWVHRFVSGVDKGHDRLVRIRASTCLRILAEMGKGER